jgi:hypothetical protein
MGGLIPAELLLLWLSLIGALALPDQMGVATEQEVLRRNMENKVCQSNLQRSCGKFSMQEARCEKCVTENSFVLSEESDTVESWSKCTPKALGDFCWGEGVDPWPNHPGALSKSVSQKLTSKSTVVNPRRGCQTIYTQFCGLVKLDGPSSCLACLKAKGNLIKADAPAFSCADTIALRTLFCQRRESSHHMAAMKLTCIYFSLQIRTRVQDWHSMRGVVRSALAAELSVTENSLSIQKLNFLDDGQIKVNYKMCTTQDASAAVDTLNSQKATAKLVQSLSKEGDFDWEDGEERSAFSNIVVNRPTFVYNGKQTGHMKHLQDASAMIAELHDATDHRQSISVMYEMQASQKFPQAAELFLVHAFTEVLTDKSVLASHEIEEITSDVMTIASSGSSQVTVLIKLVSHTAARSLLNALLRHSYTENIAAAFKLLLVSPSADFDYKVSGIKLVGLSFANQFDNQQANDQNPSSFVPHMITLAFVIGAVSGALGIHRIAKQRVARFEENEAYTAQFHEFDEAQAWSNVDTGRCESPPSDPLVSDESDSYFTDKRLHLI